MEKELQRARRISFISERHPDLSSSDASSTDVSVLLSSEKSNVELLQKVQQENKELKNALVSGVYCLAQLVANHPSFLNDRRMIWLELADKQMADSA